jgi:putative phosphoribosyl transferase
VRFGDRREAGRVLGTAVAGYAPVNPIVAALPRGGVPVGFEVALALECPLDVLVVRKIGLPGQPELAIGAVAEGDVSITNDDVITMARVAPAAYESAADRARVELADRVERYRDGLDPIDVEGRTLVIVDDGLATGSTARAAIEVSRRRTPAEVWLAVPVAPRSSVSSMRSLVDRLIVLHQPRRFIAVGAWYNDFTQTSDSEVPDLLRRSRR